MMIKNTKEHYGLIAIVLHWVVALGFLGAYAAVYFRHWFSTGDFDPVEMNSNTVALYLHLSFGITVAGFVVLRIIWKIMNVTPEDAPSSGTKFEHFLARAMHWVLYAVMIIMPVTGYMGTKLNTNFFLLFNITKFNDTWFYSVLVEDLLETDWESFEPVMDFIHKNGGAYLVWVLIVIHASAAFYHHCIRKDDVLRRMIKAQR